MKIALAQINPTLGDIRGNQQKIISFIQKAKVRNADIIVFPELSVCGYPLEDLIFHPDFVCQSYKAALEIIKHHSDDLLIVLGSLREPEINHSNNNQKLNYKKFNSALFGTNGQLIGHYDKMQLPNYGVFDEKRYFQKGKNYQLIDYKNNKILISICEDIWIDRWIADSPIDQADYLINISASPYSISKIKQREKLVKNITQRIKKPVYLCNLVGGQDELVFDGNSLVVNENSQIIQQAFHCKEDLIITDLSAKKPKLDTTNLSDKKNHQLYEIYQVLKLGVTDYLSKNQFKKAVLGLSGGIDSAFNLALICDCLGSQNVLAVSLPTRFNHQSSLTDAIEQCQLLACEHRSFEIDGLFQNYLDEFNHQYQALEGLSFQNIQARIRSNVLMAISNQENRLLIATSNKSEIAVGYSTIYGDMSGGFCPLKDVQKTLVYQLANWLNHHSKTLKIPQSVIDKPPSAELLENQTDQDNLPKYNILDNIMNDFISYKLSKKELYQKYQKESVDKVVDLIIKNQYKRFQGPPGIKITDMSFSKDWRYPLSNQFNF